MQNLKPTDITEIAARCAREQFSGSDVSRLFSDAIKQAAQDALHNGVFINVDRPTQHQEPTQEEGPEHLSHCLRHALVPVSRSLENAERSHRDLHRLLTESPSPNQMEQKACSSTTAVLDRCAPSPLWIPTSATSTSNSPVRSLYLRIQRCCSKCVCHSFRKVTAKHPSYGQIVYKLGVTSLSAYEDPMQLRDKIDDTEASG